MSEKWFPYKIIQGKDSKHQKLSWILRGNWKFNEPFLMDTVGKHFGKEPDSEKNKITEIDELLSYFSTSTESDPAGFIFHLSRCGSTTVSQMLACNAENLVLSEPGAAEGVLGLPDITVSKKLALFISAMKAFSRCRNAEEKRIFVKFSGSDVWLPWMKLAYPRTPWVFIYRDPAEVLKSNLEKQPNWIRQLKPEIKKDALLKKFETQMSTIVEHASEAALIVNYNEIDRSFPARLLKAFCLPMEKSVLTRMEESLQWYSKREGLSWEDYKKGKLPDHFQFQSDIELKAGDLAIPPQLMALYEKLDSSRR